MGKLEVEKPMIVIRLEGGLGNQMFQYAFGYALSKTHNVEFRLDPSYYEKSSLRRYALDAFNCEPEFLSPLSEKSIQRHQKQGFLAKLINYFEDYRFNYIQESAINLQSLKINRNTYFKGYWQNPCYFKAYRPDLLKQFSLKNNYSAEAEQVFSRIKTSNAVSLHVRRGDYVSNPNTNKVHGTCSLGYYREAIRFILSRIEAPHFFIFSDDYKWVKKHLDFVKSKTFIDPEVGLSDQEELILMSQCKHNIIANSSFSWWGAWLNNNNSKIVCAPKRWFADNSYESSQIIPDDWQKL